MAESEKARRLREAADIQDEIYIQKNAIARTKPGELPDARKNLGILEQKLIDKMKEVDAAKD